MLVNPKIILVSLLIFLIAFTTSAPAAESTEPPGNLHAVRADTPPVIDGKLDDLCWQKAPEATNFVDKFLDTPAHDQTVAYILFDEQSIYVAFSCFDSQPEKIIARETKRDGNFGNDDYVAFNVDPFHDHRNRSAFIINPLGTQFSFMVGGRATKTEWKGDWKAATTPTLNGWTAEIAIPFAILNYPRTDKPTTIGINFDRKQQWTQVHSFWSNIGPQEEYPERDGHLVGILFPPPKNEQKLSLLSHLLAGSSSDKNVSLQGGMNAKYQFTPNITAVTSVNPDFSNVEQDVESIDFSYQERWYPDRRPFFQEGGDFFSIGGFGFGKVRFVPLYTRRIPQFDLGVKAYGKISKTTLGLLNTTDLRDRNDAIFAVKHDIGASSELKAHFTRMDNAEEIQKRIIFKILLPLK